MIKIMKYWMIIGLFLMPFVPGCANGVNMVLVLELSSRHKANYWFNEIKQMEICHAIELEDINTMTNLLKKGVEVNNKGRQGMTFLTYAYLKSKKKSYEYLLKSGADPNLIFVTDEKLGNTVVVMKVEFSALTMAAEDEVDPSYLELDLKYGGNPNSIVGNVHILKKAINSGKLTNVQLLIEAGADVNGLVKIKGGNTPINHAITHDNYEIAYYLLQKNANPEIDKDNIMYSMTNSLSRVDQREYKEKVQKILETKGFNFKEVSFNRKE